MLVVHDRLQKCDPIYTGKTLILVQAHGQTGKRTYAVVIIPPISSAPAVGPKCTGGNPPDIGVEAFMVDTLSVQSSCTSLGRWQ